MREISLEEIEAVAARLRRAFEGTGRALSEADSRVAASAFLRGEKLGTNDLRFYKRCKDLGLDVEYVGTDPRAANYEPELVTIPPN